MLGLNVRQIYLNNLKLKINVTINIKIKTNNKAILQMCECASIKKNLNYNNIQYIQI